MKASSLRELLMAIISVMTFLPRGECAKDDDVDTPAPTAKPTESPYICLYNQHCEKDLYGQTWWTFTDEDRCFQDDQYGREEGYCWIDNVWDEGRCMNKRSYGEPCKNEAGNHDNNVCVTNYCDENALCQRRSSGNQCDDIETGETKMVYKGENALNIMGECEGDCLYDEDCAGDLKCWQRSPDHPSIPPGCKGYPPGKALETSFCYNLYSLPGLQYHGHDVQRGCGCLAECHGDCDIDRDCHGGLKCFQRDDGGPIPPGCRYGNVAPGDADFCYDPNKDARNREDIEPSPFEIVLEFSSWSAVQVACGLMVILLAACCVCIVCTGFGRCGVYGGNKKYVTVKTEDSDVELSEVEAMNK